MCDATTRRLVRPTTSGHHNVWRHVKNAHLNRRTLIGVIIAAMVALAGLTGVGVAHAHKEVTLEVDGITRPVSGFLFTVDDVLLTAGVTPAEHDEVAPGRTESIAEGTKIVVRTAHPYVVDDNGQPRTVWSTASSVKAFMESLNGGVVMAANRSSERGAIPFIAEAGTLNLVADGTTVPVDATPGDTPQTILDKANITLSPIDRVTMENVNGTLTLKVVRITRETKVDTQILPAPVEERDDDSLYEGETSVVYEGAEGKLTTTTYVETVDGQVTVNTQISQERTEPVARIIAHGTKKKPATQAPARSVSSSAPTASGDVWAALAQCESGGNPSTNTGNGFYGMYQFSLPTWQSVGGSGLPSDASAAEQTMRAQILQQRSGWGQWPACSASLGLY